ncbi:hypothetical protein, partial [Haloechinothrix sp. LS1_15]|uniref:hypothetical protein n=1 Tax=Haloechinothrix sp. LS1_15 TaxID=2652248 RepID=UPI002945AF34
MRFPSPAPRGGGPSWAELVEQLHALEVQRQAAAIQGEILAEMADRGPLAEYGYPSLPSLLRDVLQADLA